MWRVNQYANVKLVKETGIRSGWWASTASLTDHRAVGRLTKASFMGLCRHLVVSLGNKWCRSARYIARYVRITSIVISVKFCISRGIFSYINVLFIHVHNTYFQRSMTSLGRQGKNSLNVELKGLYLILGFINGVLLDFLVKGNELVLKYLSYMAQKNI